MGFIMDIIGFLYSIALIIGWYIAPIGLLAASLSLLYSVISKNKKWIIILSVIIIILALCLYLSSTFTIFQD